MASIQWKIPGAVCFSLFYTVSPELCPYNLIMLNSNACLDLSSEVKDEGWNGPAVNAEITGSCDLFCRACVKSPA